MSSCLSALAATLAENAEAESGDFALVASCLKDADIVTVEDLALLGNGITVADSTLAEILGDHCEANRKALLTMLHFARRGFPG